MAGEVVVSEVRLRTAISEGNPYGPDRYGYCWEMIHGLQWSGKHLDFGSYDGGVPFRLLSTGAVSTAVAADVVDTESLFREQYGNMIPGGLSFVSATRRPLPFDDGYFDTVSLLDVMEHVADQDSLLKEICRILSPTGRLIVTVPKQHCFSMLDTGNWKFVFPGLHRRYYSAKQSGAAYYSRYVDPRNGLVGDIEIAKSWHEHFTEASLVSKLAANGLAAVSLDGAGLFARPLALARYVAPAGWSSVLARLAAYDAARFSSTHLFCTARKVD